MLKQVFIVLAAMWLAAGCTLLPRTSGPAKTVTILGTADLQGIMTAQVEKIDLDDDGRKEEHTMGGISRLATRIQEVKKENPEAIVVSSGDDLMNRFFHTFKGKAVFSLLSAAGYELYAFGNHEFDKGSEVLAAALENARFTPLCSDLDVSVSALKGTCRVYAIREVAGAKVGFFSLMTEEFPRVTLEKKVRLATDNVTTARKMVRLLRQQGAEVIVAISHIGYRQDVALARQVKGIDLIFGGHSHDYLSKIGRVHDTAIVNGGSRGHKLVRVDIPLDRDGRANSSGITMTLLPVDESVDKDAEIARQVQEYVQQLPAAIVLGRTLKDWNLKEDEVRQGESDVANMINDLLRKQFQVDIVLNNSGAFQGEKVYSAGEITDLMFREIDRFNNDAFMFTLEGRYLREIFEHSAANYGKGGFLQISGLRCRIDLSATPQRIEQETVIQPGSRVQQLQVERNGQWQDVDPEKAYTVLSNAFMVNHAGDGYFWFRKYGKNFRNTFTTFYSIMASYLQEHGELTPKEKDGRIQVVR